MNPKPVPRKKFIKWLAVPLGLAVCLTPIATSALPWAAPAPAVSAPSPMGLQSTPAAEFRRAAALMSGLGLSETQRNTLWSRMDDELLTQLETGSLSGRELEYLTLPNYDTTLADRYQLYEAANPELSLADVVTNVNIGLDRPFYLSPTAIDDPDSTTVLVNKYHGLSKDYVPQLESLGSGYGAGSLRPEAARQFRNMADAARIDGITLYSVSAYRSYLTQTTTYNRYLSQYRRQTVDEFSARPGHSEHQTGLALDINVARTSAHFENTAEYAWLVEHCAEYGFILRYPSGKEHITGYRFEPWHYRYVGVEIARLCMEQGLTYEEYVAQLPADELNQVELLTHQGQILDLGGKTLVLGGIDYVSAAHLAEALGWAAGSTSEGNDLILYGSEHRLLLYPGMRCQRDESVVRLTWPALELDGSLYLSLEDLCSLMELSAIPSGLGLELVHYQLL